MSNISQITESLATSVKTLVEKHKELMIELKEIRSYNNLLKNQITDKDNKITELNEKLKNQTTNSAGNGEAEKFREVQKAYEALMNKKNS